MLLRRRRETKGYRHTQAYAHICLCSLPYHTMPCTSLGLRRSSPDEAPCPSTRTMNQNKPLFPVSTQPQLLHYSNEKQAHRPLFCNNQLHSNLEQLPRFHSPILSLFYAYLQCLWVTVRKRRLKKTSYQTPYDLEQPHFYLI